MSEAQQHLVMPVKTGIQEEMDSCPLEPGLRQDDRLRGFNYEMGHYVLKE